MKPGIQKIIQGALFVVCAIPGLLFLLVSTLELFAYFDPMTPVSQNVPNPVVSIAVLVGSSFLMLIGVGKWRQWRYLLVFLAIPIFMGVSFLIPFKDKFSPVLFIGFATFLTYHLARVTDGIRH
ncbi:MAG: hypothetical protein WC381_01930 [Kiritimatiellia bacterium]|jgi:hypothetical protein